MSVFDGGSAFDGGYFYDDTGEPVPVQVVAVTAQTMVVQVQAPE